VRPHEVHSNVRFSTVSDMGSGSIIMIRIFPPQTKQLPHNAGVGSTLGASMTRPSADVPRHDYKGTLERVRL
jgi:hypothetical protein